MITFKLKEEEFIEGSLDVALWPRRQVVVIALQISVLLGIGGALAFSKGISADIASVGPFFAGFAGIALIAIAIGRPIAFRRKFRLAFSRFIEPLPPATVSWGEAGLVVELGGKKTFKAWRDFIKVSQTQLLIILYEQQAKVVMLPKRAFSESTELEKFSEFLSSRIGAN